MPETAPYGSWKSPVTADVIVAETIHLGSVSVDGECVYWLEGRPAEGGRNVLVQAAADGTVADVTPAPFNVRTRVHEYGGGDYAVHAGNVWFSNFEDQRVYVQPGGAKPRALTAPGPYRYADMVLDSLRRQLVCVREDHSSYEGEPTNALVGIDLDDGTTTVLASGHDFYSSPRVSPDGKRLAWLSWDHPNMPWDGTTLWMADWAGNGRLMAPRKISGGRSESVFQPEWSPRGELYFVDDRSGWWNLYRWRQGSVESLCPLQAEFGLPQWQFGMSTYAFGEAGQVICACSTSGSWGLARLYPDGAFRPISTPFTQFHSLRVKGRRAVFVGGAPDRPSAVTTLDLQTEQTAVLRRSSLTPVMTEYLSIPEPVSYPTGEDETAHALFYAPRNRDFQPPPREKPPLLVRSHGGPTSATSAVFNPGIQFWTSRGFAVLDVNYRGSSGYGRAYRNRLQHGWGAVDVEDCIQGARYLVGAGHADPSRLAVRGSSAGGYTTLAALTFHHAFQAGASYYGISDLEALARDTHKFESRYLDRLVGAYPEQRGLYRARSPIHHAEGLSCPVIFFQGLEDNVVPPDQAASMVQTLRDKGLPVAYLAFEGEQHGFRQAQTIKRTLEAELYFYGRVFGFQPADRIEPVPIENL